MEIAIEKLVALCCLVFGLSHVLQPRMWVDFFIYLREKGETGVVVVALLHLPFGALIVSTHNIWHGLPMIVTIIGWGWTLKGTLYLLYPKHALRMFQLVSHKRAWHFVAGGAALIVVSLLIIYSLLNPGVIVS